MSSFQTKLSQNPFLHQRFIANNVHAESSKVKAFMISDFLGQVLIQQCQIDFGNFSSTQMNGCQVTAKVFHTTIVLLVETHFPVLKK